MKTIFTFLVILLSITFANSQIIELPFYEDFEESISNDATFLNWTTENLKGWHYWHIVPGQHMRFENNDVDQNDWLITRPIKTVDADSLLIRFSTLYSQQGTKPKLLYTSDYTDDAQNDTWTEIEYELGDENQWHSSGDIIIKSPDSLVWFAFHSNQEANKGIYFLLDNFSVSKYDPVIYEKVGTTEHFEFYTSFSAETDYWQDIEESLEKSFLKYCGIWNIEGKEDFIDKNIKTKVYYTEKANIPFINERTPETKSGFFNSETKTIYLTPLNTPQKLEYYGSTKELAINTFAQYAKINQVFREHGYNDLPEYFKEGFGLYEQGFRPRLDSIMSFRSVKRQLKHEDLDEMNVFSGTSQKDIIVSYVEGQIVGLLDYFGTAPYSSYEWIWNNHLVHFYDTTDVVRIKKYASNEHFDIYCSARDTMFIDSFFVWLERPRQFYIDSFQIEVTRKYNLVIYYDEKTGMDMTGYDNWNGGAGGLDISPHNFWGGPYDGYDWLLAHEFSHVYNSIIYPEMPVGFYHEGMANLGGGMATGGNEELKSYDDLWKVEYVFNFYKNKFDREPTLEELITNPHAGEPGLEYGADCYFFGTEFARYLRDTQGYLKIKEFFQSGLDFSVFNKSYEEIEQGYIERLKYLHSIRDYNEPVILKNSTMNVERGNSGIISDENLHATDVEVPDDELIYKIKTAPLYGIIEKVDNPGVKVYKFSEEDIQNSKIRYVSNGVTETSDFFIFELTDRTFFIPNKQFNFALTTPTGISALTENTLDLHVHPNPVTSNSKIQFNLKNSGKVELTIFNLQGKKISNISNEILNAGNHEFPIGQYLTKKGIYLCSLQTNNNVSTLKLIVE